MDDTQLALFDNDSDCVNDLTQGYRAPAVQAIAGVTYRQLDYWARTALIEPSVQPAAGSGSQRLYSFSDIVVVRIVKRLLDTGVSLQSIRTAVTYLREHNGPAALAQATLICDGVSIYECVTDEEVIDLLSGGQGVFAIAVNRTIKDVRGAVVNFPAESCVDAAAMVGDELAARRAAKAS